MRELRHWQPTHPIVLFVIGDESQECFNPLIGSFRLPVRSRVIGRGYILLYTHQLAQFPRELGRKLRVSIADDLAW